ncbi:hypothetical protein GGF32_003039 [Allomyces javanicus]|nr:hypothetical protein GGF32_003039 [Allomyces javanicus]
MSMAPRSRSGRSVQRGAVSSRRLLALLLAVGYLALVATTAHASKDQFCTAPVCQSAGDFLTRTVNMSRKRNETCSNFHESVCDGWRQLVDKPDHMSRFSVLAKIHRGHKARLRALVEDRGTSAAGTPALKQLRTLYDQCVVNAFPDPEMVPEFKAALARWRAMDVTTPLGVHRAVLEGMKTGGSFLYGLTVDANSRNSDEMAVWAKQGGLSLASPRHYTDRKYRALYLDLLKHLIADFELTGDAHAVLAFETELARISDSPTNLRNPYHSKPVTEATPVFPAKLQAHYTVIMDSPSYFASLKDLLAHTPKRTLKQYFITRQLQAMLTHMHYQPMLDFRAKALHMKPPPTEEYCLSVLDRYLPYLTSLAQLQDRDAYPGGKADWVKMQADVKEMVERMRETYLQVVRESKWMSPATKKTALDKLANVKLVVGGEPWMLDEQAVLEFYRAYARRTSWYATFMNFRVRDKVKTWRKLGAPNKRESATAPMVVNAFYSQPNNRITVPFGILQYPLYHVDYPLPMKLAGIGMIVAHEFTHALDSRGRRYDLNGNLANWWADKDLVQFTQKSECYVDQYNAFKIHGVSVNGRLTNAENMADNVAITLIHRIAEQAHYSPRVRILNEHGTPMPGAQAFFTAMAANWCVHFDVEAQKTALLHAVHAPSSTRVNGALQNLPAFDKTFKCPKETKRERCTLW